MNYYEVLNVENDASVEHIHRAYKKLALGSHPDRIVNRRRLENPQISELELDAHIAKAQREFQVINQAHEILSDTEKRKNYDHHLASGDSESEFVDTEGQSGLPFSFDEFFRGIPLGYHISAKSVQKIVTTIDTELQKILSKSPCNPRYTRVKHVISELRNELLELKNTHFADFGNKRAVSEQDFYNFLLDTIIAVRQAKNTREPATHRGIFRGTPILRELASLIEALIRLIGFCFFKLYKYLMNDRTPVYANGLCQGLFKPTRTRTATVLDSIDNYLDIKRQQYAVSLNNSVDSQRQGLTIFGTDADHFEMWANMTL